MVLLIIYTKFKFSIAINQVSVQHKDTESFRNQNCQLKLNIAINQVSVLGYNLFLNLFLIIY